MDFLFNRKIPKSSHKQLIFKPVGKTFITGLAYSYEHYYDESFLSAFISETQFNYLMNSLNEELFSYWPCCACFYFGYIFCICTAGLSFLCPNFCISTAKENFLKKLDYYNSQHFHPKGLDLSYNQKCSTSWLKLTTLEYLKSSCDFDNLDISNNISTNSGRKILRNEKVKHDYENENMKQPNMGTYETREMFTPQ